MEKSPSAESLLDLRWVEEVRSELELKAMKK